MNRHVEYLKQEVLAAFEGKNVRVFLFGSRARGTNRPGADIDIGIIPQENNLAARVSALRARLEDSNIPLKVDIVNFLEVSESFRQNALKDAIIWKN